METTHETLHLRQISLGKVKDHGHTKSFILSLVYFLKLLNTAMVLNFKVILGHAEPLSAEVCDFMHCHIFVN
jgi:hypothetical protein